MPEMPVEDDRDDDENIVDDGEGDDGQDDDDLNHMEGQLQMCLSLLDDGCVVICKWIRI